MYSIITHSLLTLCIVYIVAKIFILKQNYQHHTAIAGFKHIESVLFRNSNSWSKFNFRAAMVLYIPSTGYKFASSEEVKALQQLQSNLLFVRIVERRRYILCQSYKMQSDIISVYDIIDRKTINPHPCTNNDDTINRLIICCCKRGGENIQELALVDLD
jgi:hypothetical protein